MNKRKIVSLALAAVLALGAPTLVAGPALAASSVGDKALKDGCKQRYATNKKKYNACVAGNEKSNDAQIDGCYARYKHQRDKLKQCLGR